MENKLDQVEVVEMVYRNGQLARRSKRRKVLVLGGMLFHRKDIHYYSVATSTGTTPFTVTNNRTSNTSNNTNNTSMLDNNPTRCTANRQKTTTVVEQ